MYREIIFFIIVVLLFTSCSKTFIGVTFVDCERKSYSIADGPNIRIINTGKIGISSIALETDSGKIILCGTNPGDTSIYFKIPPLCKNTRAEFMMYRTHFLGREKGYIISHSKDINEVCQKIISGNYSLLVSVFRRKKGRYDLISKLNED